MDERQALAQLRATLADLYPDLGNIRRIVDDAGLDDTKINFGGPATDVWHSVLQEARKVSGVEELVQIALEEYPRNRALPAAWENYKNIGKNNRTDSSPPAPQDDQTRPSRSDGLDEIQVPPEVRKVILFFSLLLVSIFLTVSPEFSERLRKVLTDGIKPSHTTQVTPTPTLDITIQATLGPAVFSPVCDIIEDNSEIRAGPSMFDEIVRIMATGEEVVATSVYFSELIHSETGTWVQIQDKDGSFIGWVSKSRLKCRSSMDDLPEITPPP